MIASKKVPRYHRSLAIIRIDTKKTTDTKHSLILYLGYHYLKKYSSLSIFYLFYFASIVYIYICFCDSKARYFWVYYSKKDSNLEKNEVNKSSKPNLWTMIYEIVESQTLIVSHISGGNTADFPASGAHSTNTVARDIAVKIPKTSCGTHREIWFLINQSEIRFDIIMFMLARSA